MNTLILTNVIDVCNEIQKLPLPIIVGVEGFMSSGKTILSNKISFELGAGVIHIDEYILPTNDSKSYDEYVNYVNLKLMIDKLREVFQIIIIEGICLQDVLTNIEIFPDFFIYIKRLSPNGIWHDGIDFGEYKTTQNISLDNLNLSNMKYHLEKCPQETANLIFHRVES